MDELKNIIADNLTLYRKEKGLTQLEIANTLNYSDKAVSKWERGESLPDITVLKQLADLYGVTVDAFLQKERSEPIRKRRISRLLRRHKLIIPFLSAGIVWLIATIAFVFLSILLVWDRPWLCFVYAVPVSIVVLIVFNAIWGNKILSSIIVSLFIWSIPAALTLTLIDYAKIYYVYFIAIPCQVLVILWYIMRVRNTRRKNKTAPDERQNEI